MRWAWVAVLVGACGGEQGSVDAAPSPDASVELVDRDRACGDFALAFCAKSTPCFPDIPLEWCIEQETDVCQTEWGDAEVTVGELELCRDAIRDLDCPPPGEELEPPTACCAALGC